MINTGEYKNRHRGWVNSNPVRAKRYDGGLTLSELSSALGVHPQTILTWEHGTRIPSDENLETIARYLEVSTEEARQIWADWIDDRPTVDL